MGRPIVSFEFNPGAMGSIRYLQNYVLTMPNRINNIRVVAVNSAARRMKTYLRDNYGRAGRGMFVNPRIRKGSASLLITTEKASYPVGSKATARDKELWAANIMFYGRKAFSARRSPEQKSFRLREGSRGKYPEYLRSIKVPAMSPNYSAKSDIKQKASAILAEQIKKEVANQGFGVRGGNPSRMKDTAHISKSTAPNPSVKSRK